MLPRRLRQRFDSWTSIEICEPSVTREEGRGISALQPQAKLHRKFQGHQSASEAEDTERIGRELPLWLDCLQLARHAVTAGSYRHEVIQRESSAETGSPRLYLMGLGIAFAFSKKLTVPIRPDW